MHTVMITGVTGFLGIHVLRSLLDNSTDIAVRGLVRNTATLDSSLARSIDILQGDVTRPASLEGKFQGVRTVVHLASKVVASKPSEYLQVNVEGTRHVAECCIREGVQHLIYVSSAAIYGFEKSKDGEEHELLKPPLTPVSRSRYEAEKVLIDYHRRNQIRVSILRPLFVYGKGDRFFIPSILRSLLHMPIIINGGKACFSVISAKDLGDTIKSFINAKLPARDYPVYHATDGRPVSLKEVVRLLCEELQLKYPSFSMPYHLVVSALMIAGLKKKIFTHHSNDGFSSKQRDISSIEFRHRIHLVSYNHYYSNKRLTTVLPRATFIPFAEQMKSLIPYYQTYMQSFAR